jgi:hypothetical protein
MRILIAMLIGFISGVAITLAVIATGLLAPSQPPVAIQEWGEFPVPARVELLDDGRQVRLLEDFVYLDPRGRAWTASKDSIVNGASIPKAFWTITGGPFEGKYRNASIVHDEACVRMTEPSENVHLMFYEACRCGGVSEYQAKVLYAAVYHFGPKWTIRRVMEQKTRIGPDGQEQVVTVTRTVPTIERPTEDPATVVRDKLDAYIKSENPSLSDIESLNLDSL